MKTMKIYEHKDIQLKRKSRLGVIRAGLAIVVAFGIGVYVGSTMPLVNAETITNDTGIIHVVNTDETLWDIARPIADERGIDIREIIYEIQVNNDLGPDPTLTPGQRLVIRY